MKKRIFLSMCVILCIAGSIACSKKEVEKAQIENDVKVEAEKYDDDNEPVTVLENNLVNTEFNEISGEEFRSYIKEEAITKDNWKDFFVLKKEQRTENEANGTVYVLSVDKVHQKKDFCFVFDIKNKDITAKDCVFEKNTISMEWGNKNSDGKETELSIDDFVGKRVEGTIIYADVPNEIWRACKDGTDKNGFRVKDADVLYEFYDDGVPVKLDSFIERETDKN